MTTIAPDAPIDVFLDAIHAALSADEIFGNARYTLLLMPPPQSEVKPATVYMDMEGLSMEDMAGGAVVRMTARFVVTTVYSLSVTLTHARNVRRARRRMYELVQRVARDFMQSAANDTPAAYIGFQAALVRLLPEEPVIDDEFRYSLVAGEVTWDEQVEA